ncbi:MAG TPA: Rieske 2Fe-2S domain-containing protein [Nocardioidaceae bacterium]|nr:Rieske 2Fe-2S domain-containing protein [Nocardioidaceae bacterium]
MSDEDRPGDELEPRDEHEAEPEPEQEPVPDPGFHEHGPRPTDLDPALELRAERQVSGMFGLATLLGLGFCVAYFAVPEDKTILGFNALNFTLGMTLGGSLLLIGMGAVQWAKRLMIDDDIIEARHAVASSEENRAEALEIVTAGAAESGLGRRTMIRNSMLGALGVLGLPAIVVLRDLGPLPTDESLRTTVWTKGMRVVNDVAGTPIRPEDIELGQLVNGEPSVLVSTGDEAVDEENHVIEGIDQLNAKAKAAVILVRMRPDEVTPPKGREDWGVDGILCFSKICTHVGCPISLWEQQTHNVLCPCHQSTFDLADGGKVTFGPAHRPLPQLQLGVDDEGYLIAMGDFEDQVGPSFPELG